MEIFRRGAWWAGDYVYAVKWQALALVNRADPVAYRTGTGTPVVVLPGIYETWKFMQPVIERLHSQGHPVHVVTDLRRSNHPVEEMAEQVTRYLQESGLDDVVVVAHSKGGLAGKLVMVGPAGEQVRGMIAIATPFGGSRYARIMLVRSLRAFSTKHPSITGLAQHVSVNSRIMSVYARFDPHIPERSELDGATNVPLDTGGHFRILARPEVLDRISAFVK
jgi:pimeloyl-ACP methyl ester carboxylesterase